MNMERHSSITSYLASVVAGLSVNEVVGLVLGVGTFFVNWYYAAKKARRAD